jgi:hypothetical protein
MKSVYYSLHHIYGDDTDETEEVSIFVGIFSTAQNAKKAIKFLAKQPEFINFPKKCFVCCKTKLDQYWWKDGYSTWKETLDL